MTFHSIVLIIGITAFFASVGGLIYALVVGYKINKQWAEFRKQRDQIFNEVYEEIKRKNG